MNPGEQFEIDCYNYLLSKYGPIFMRQGGMDSTTSDIAVIKNNRTNFYIEAKSPEAQSGQFVLLPDEENERFVFSPRNHSEPNDMTDIIINYMNEDFYKFNNAGTAGAALNIDTRIFADWIINHYENRNVKYVISNYPGQGFVIFPIRKFSEYFSINATYRIKKSGSSEPSKKDLNIVVDLFKKAYPSSSFESDGKKLFVSISSQVSQNKFVLDKYTYYLSPQSENYYEIRKLSNTNNMNVIFSISLIETQGIGDLQEFENDL